MRAIHEQPGAPRSRYKKNATGSSVLLAAQGSTQNGSSVLLAAQESNLCHLDFLQISAGDSAGGWCSFTSRQQTHQSPP